MDAAGIFSTIFYRILMDKRGGGIMNRQQRGMVFDIQRWSLHDGPGIRTNIFLKGCPLSCLWCSNPESQSHKRELAFFGDKCIGCHTCTRNCPRQAIKLDNGEMVIDFACCRMYCGMEKAGELSFACSKTCYAKALDIMGQVKTAEEVLTEVLRDKPIYDSSGGGMTVTGGEPFAQPEFLRELLMLAKTEHLHTVIESCLYAPWDYIRQCLQYVDFMFMDLKTLDDNKHKEVTGKGNRLILENMIRIHHMQHEHNIKLAVRTPVVPGVNDTPAGIGAIADWIVTNLPGVEYYELLPYHRLGRGKYLSIGKEYSLTDLCAPSDASMESLKDEIKKRGLHIK